MSVPPPKQNRLRWATRRRALALAAQRVHVLRHEVNTRLKDVHLVRLPSGGLFVYSPSWLGDDTFARIEKHGTPEVLFAPNAYHHVSLEKFRARWPQALAYASSPSLPRLLKKGHPNLHDAA